MWLSEVRLFIEVLDDSCLKFFDNRGRRRRRERMRERRVLMKLRKFGIELPNLKIEDSVLQNSTKLGVYWDNLTISLIGRGEYKKAMLVAFWRLEHFSKVIYQLTIENKPVEILPA